MLFRVLLITISPLLSLAIFNLGSSFLTTLLAVRLQLDSQTDFIIGLLSSVFFVGYILGTHFSQRFIIRVGHIRAYAFFTSIIAVVSMLHGLFLDTTAWMVLRMINGFCTGAIWIVIESWLLTLSDRKTQGQVLALYMIFYYGSQSAAQFFLKLGDITQLIPFCVITIFSSLSVIPLTCTRVGSPQFSEHTPLSPLALAKKAPLGVTGCFIGGCVLSVLLGLMPATIQEFGFNIHQVANIMAILVLGGTFLQYPIGKLSDFINRRTVLLSLAISTTLISFLLTYASSYHDLTFYILLFLLGGTTFTIYPLSISYSYDFVDPKAVVATASALLLSYSFGSVAGPLIAPIFTIWIGAKGIFFYFGITTAILALLATWRTFTRPPLSREDQDNFITVPQLTPVAMESLDPRADIEPEEQIHERESEEEQ